ncbi:MULTISPECIES: hypothetical protein [Nocardia]|uniref:Uncharacterized protein n=1 Tax=Nocardia arthritidis TaxID=228602 RepID=A0A6G9YTZ9_9NOCA|nr:MULTISPECIES: hypothetical protein [Nocardia]QIS16620.1 hypothetical protein F5544_44085 [Nocardia arthritidis]
MAVDRFQVRVVLVFGEQAQLETPWSTRETPVWVPASDIAQQAELPVNELPGRLFWVTRDDNGLSGFRLVFDPRL